MQCSRPEGDGGGRGTASILGFASERDGAHGKAVRSGGRVYLGGGRVYFVCVCVDLHVFVNVVACVCLTCICGCVCMDSMWVGADEVVWVR